MYNLLVKMIFLLFLRYKMSDVDELDEELNHNYSLELLENPWTVAPLYEKHLLQYKNNNNFIDIPYRNKLVTNALMDPTIDQLIYNASKYSDRCRWAEYIDGDVEHFACFNVASIIANLWLSKDPSMFSVSLDKDIIEDTEYFTIVPEQLTYMYGVFKMDINFIDDFHSFVIYMTDNTIIIYNTYATFKELFITTFDRSSWLKMFLGISTISTSGQKIRYPKIWGFKKSMTDVIWKYNPNAKMTLDNIQCIRLY